MIYRNLLLTLFAILFTASPITAKEDTQTDYTAYVVTASTVIISTLGFMLTRANAHANRVEAALATTTTEKNLLVNVVMNYAANAATTIAKWYSEHKTEKQGEALYALRDLGLAIGITGVTATKPATTRYMAPSIQAAIKLLVQLGGNVVALFHAAGMKDVYQLPLESITAQ